MKHYFDKETQNIFWENLSPDIRTFLDSLEERETWTYQVKEFESLFLSMAGALPKIIQLPLSEEHKSLVQKLIPVLVSMPLRQCISAIAYLDKYGQSDSNPVGWGILCFIEAKNISQNEDDPLYPYSRNLCERINTFTRNSICVELFEHIKSEGH
ncbi:hypothetical protein L1267_15950 [Pseudoalteromonas sp. OFAV1]|jgi:hypothetical protein|uniref:hypothetical protein n=1 Tax=Pseudoalteromonas sp. OFAV1 TaxID=2908892 RepID=UPI001F1959D6|nr:hypothetical protein [Pseudoalteromonas sp. OFAV1]MCF2901870.1 hypothetical protein [Pseudoalteromonas sp. OFAV1]